MPFCPKCKALMLPKDGKFTCPKCGDSTQKKQKKRIVTSEYEEKETVVLEGGTESVHPKTKALCPKCGHNEAYFYMMQTRRSDEPPTRIYTCTKCSHRWREY